MNEENAVYILRDDNECMNNVGVFTSMELLIDFLIESEIDIIDDQFEGSPLNNFYSPFAWGPDDLTICGSVEKIVLNDPSKKTIFLSDEEVVTELKKRSNKCQHDE